LEKPFSGCWSCCAGYAWKKAGRGSYCQVKIGKSTSYRVSTLCCMLHPGLPLNLLDRALLWVQVIWVDCKTKGIAMGAGICSDDVAPLCMEGSKIEMVS